MANRLTNLKIDEVSFCKLGMNQHAKVALFKSADGLTGPIALAKKTFQEALNAQLVSEKISDTFWRAFENQWAVRDAFRVALTDEISEGGDGSDAIDGFTAAMQQIATLAASAARDAASTAETDLEAAVEEAVSKWLQTKEQPMKKYLTKAALLTAATSFVFAKASAGDMTAIVDDAVELDAVDDLPASQPELVAAAKAKKGAPDHSAELAKAQREIAVLKLSPEAKTYHDSLDAAGQTAFLGKSATDQAADIAKANAADPVVYTCTDGTAIRKSDGAAAAILAKRSDEQAALIAKLTGTLEGDAIETRATRDFPRVAKSVAVSMLKSAKAVGEDSEAGKAVLTSLGEMNKARGSLFTSLGSVEAVEGQTDLKKALSDFNGVVAKIMDRDKIGQGDAMSKARNEEPDLFLAAYPDYAEQDA